MTLKKVFLLVFIDIKVLAVNRTCDFFAKKVYVHFFSKEAILKYGKESKYLLFRM